MSHGRKSVIFGIIQQRGILQQFQRVGSLLGTVQQIGVVRVFAGEFVERLRLVVVPLFVEFGSLVPLRRVVGRGVVTIIDTELRFRTFRKLHLVSIILVRTLALLAIVVPAFVPAVLATFISTLVAAFLRLFLLISMPLHHGSQV